MSLTLSIRPLPRSVPTKYCEKHTKTRVGPNSQCPTVLKTYIEKDEVIDSTVMTSPVRGALHTLFMCIRL